MSKRALADTVQDPVAKFLKQGEDRSRGRAVRPVAETKSLNAKIPKNLLTKVKVYCAARDLTVQDFIIETLEEKLKGTK